MLNRNVYKLPWQSVSTEWHVHRHLVIAKISNGCCQSGLWQECLGITETAWIRISHRCSTKNQNKHNPRSRAASPLSLPGGARVFGCQNNKCLHWRAVHSAWERAGRDSSSCRDMTAAGSVQAMGPGSSQHTSAAMLASISCSYCLHFSWCSVNWQTVAIPVVVFCLFLHCFSCEIWCFPLLVSLFFFSPWVSGCCSAPSTDTQQLPLLRWLQVNVCPAE